MQKVPKSRTPRKSKALLRIADLLINETENKSKYPLPMFVHHLDVVYNKISRVTIIFG